MRPEQFGIFFGQAFRDHRHHLNTGIVQGLLGAGIGAVRTDIHQAGVDFRMVCGGFGYGFVHRYREEPVSADDFIGFPGIRRIHERRNV